MAAAQQVLAIQVGAAHATQQGNVTTFFNWIKARKQKHSHIIHVNPPHKGRRIPSTTALFL